MKFMKTLTAGVAAIALTSAFATVATPVLAQQTTSDIRGVVTNNTGAPLTGAVVTVTDTRTGASRTLSTDTNGSFSARNLTVGGPYTVSVSANGFRSERLEGLSVSIAGSTSVTIDLETVVAGGATDEIVVVASRANVSELAIGPSSSFGLEELEAFPSISRDIRDVIRIDPRVVIDGSNDDNISCIGGNNRFNSFTIDGVRSADAFGLNASGFPSRNNLPIPFDAVRETSVEFSPFDVEYGQFTGCNINVVTQSGTNEFHGAAFAVFNSSGLTGGTIDGNDVSGDEFKDYNWGASVGGPIIKDKLFFFVAYEEVKDGGDIVDFGPEGEGFAEPIEGLTLAEVDQVSDILSSVYGLDSGGISRVLPEDARKILTRWDWNINDDHRLEFTYSRLREGNIEPDDQGFDADFIFANTFELEGTRAETYSTRLFSQWTDNFSTELRASRNDIQDLQGPVGGGEAQDANPIPIFRISEGDGNVLQNGPGQFRSANDGKFQVDQIKAKANYIAGNHNLSVGYELDQLDVFNLFIVSGTGIFTFDSIEDLQTGLTSQIEGNGSFSGDPSDAAAIFSRSIHSIYAQDEWQVTDALNVSVGLRYDFYTSSDIPAESQAFVDRLGFSNTQAFDGLNILLPRFAFDYDAGNTFFGTTTFRGGAGVFSGGDPTVWFSNAYNNSGSLQGSGEIFDEDVLQGDCTTADLQVLNGGSFTGIPNCVLSQQQSSALSGNGRISAIDPDFEIPSIIRGSFGFTHITDFGGSASGLFDDWRVDVDVIHSRRRNAPDFVDLTLTPIGTAPDGRNLYNAIDPLSDGCDAVFQGPRIGFSGPADQLAQGGACDAFGNDQDILLTNVDEAGGNGGSTTVSAIFSKEFDLSERTRLSFTTGYAYTDAKDVNPSTSSTDTSNFEELAVVNINYPQRAPGQFFNKHNITIAARFGHEFVKDYETSFNFFYNGRSGRRFSYAYDNNTPTTLFGDSDNEERNLFYVPTLDDPTVVFADAGFFNDDDVFIVTQSAEEAEAGLNQFIADNGLEGSRGQIVGRNAFTNPWFHDLDFRFQQELPGVRSQDRSYVYVDIENMLNLIDDGLGVFREHDNGDVEEAVPVLDAACAVSSGSNCSVYEYSNFNPGGSSYDPNVGIFADRDTDDTVWAVQIGFRYEF